MPGRTVPTTPSVVTLPEQAAGVRPARALPYELHVRSQVIARDKSIKLTFANTGSAAAVFHVYDRLNLDAIPHRYTVEAGKSLAGTWETSKVGTYDLWVLGPNGFHRHFTGNINRVIGDNKTNPDVIVSYDKIAGELNVRLINKGTAACVFKLTANKYFDKKFAKHTVEAGSEVTLNLPIRKSAHWYDFSVRVKGQTLYSRRFAGHMETGKGSFTDPAMQGQAIADQYAVKG